MKVMNKKKYALVLMAVAVVLTAVSCSYDEEPARTTDATTSYVTPKGELPTAEEKEYVQMLINEYNESIKTIK